MRVSLLDKNTVKISFAYRADLIGFVKALPDRKYEPAGRYWTMPLKNVPLTLKVLQDAGFLVEQPVMLAHAEMVSAHRRLKELSKQEDVPFESPLPLMPYQKVGAKFMVDAGSALLADDVGLGKTIQFLAAAWAVGAQRVLIFCPAILKYQWQAEIQKFFGPMDLTIQVIAGKPEERIRQWKAPLVNVSPTFVIANYELLLRDMEYMQAINWDVIGADEATRISNQKAKTVKAIKKLRATHRYALTGTPVSNRPAEIWSIIDFVSPGALGSYWGFINRYMWRNNFGIVIQYKNMDELAQRIKPYMIRRLKKDVAIELPPLLESDVPFKMSVAEHKLYLLIRAELVYKMEPGQFSKVEDPTTIQDPIVKMLRLRQLCDSMELLGTHTTSTKLEVLRELLLTLSERKTIIFTEFKEMAKILHREFGGHIITGDVENEKRQPILDQFAVDDSKILVMNNAGEYGLNVQAASVVIHYDQPLSVRGKIQREGRAHRKDQKAESVLVYNLLAQGSIDMHIKKLLEKKAATSNDVLEDVPVIQDRNEIERALAIDPDYE